MSNLKICKFCFNFSTYFTVLFAQQTIASCSLPKRSFVSCVSCDISQIQLDLPRDHSGNFVPCRAKLSLQASSGRQFSVFV